MYYTYFSTGNVKIDSEHANLDTMINLCRNKSGAWEPSALILLSSLANHLDSEETICRKEGLNMTQDHLEEHRLLKSKIAVIEKQVRNKALEKTVFLTTLLGLLFIHISDFDKHLNRG